MTLEASLCAALSPLVNGRVFPDAADFDTPLPYITYQQVGGVPVNYVGGESSSQKNARIQINVWSKTRIEAALISRLIEDLMVLPPLGGEVAGGVIADYDVGLALRGTSQDFSFWS
jgi:hypothetical protein